MDRASLQAAQILCAFGLGLTLGLFYDFYRIWLRKGRKKMAAAVGDVLWWTFALLWAFFWLLQINWAELRIPVVLMVFLGLGLYIFCFSPIFLPLFNWIWQGIAAILRFLGQTLLQALQLLFAPVVICSGFCYRLFYRAERGTGWLVQKSIHSSQKMKRKVNQKAKEKAAAKKKRREEKKAVASRQKVEDGENPSRARGILRKRNKAEKQQQKQEKRHNNHQQKQKKQYMQQKWGGKTKRDKRKRA